MLCVLNDSPVYLILRYSELSKKDALDGFGEFDKECFCGIKEDKHLL